MSAIDDVAQMLALIPWLRERPGATVAETARAFGISEKETRQHLYHLAYCGLPGLGGGDLFDVEIFDDRIVVSMADELRRPLRLVPREALTLVLVGEAVAQTLDEELPALRSALDKVRVAAGVPSEVRVQLEEDGVEWVAVLREAIASGRQIAIEYQGRGDETPTRRVVDPWRLHVSEGYRYLQGRDHRADALRSFRLDRVGAVEVLTDARVQDPPADELPTPRYEPSEGDVEVELVLSRAAGWVADAVDPDVTEELDDGRRRLRFHTDALPWVRCLCLAAGDSVEVVAPPELRDDVRRAASDALERYSASA